MVLSERGEQLAALEELLTGCVQGSGRVVIVNGPVASGKTALLQAFAQRVAASDAMLLTAIASRAERATALGVIREILRGAELDPDGAERVAALLNDYVLTAALNQDAPDADTPLMAPALSGLCGELMKPTERRPLVICVDDVHHADTESLHVLLYLARRLDTARILLVLTKSTQVRTAHAPFYAELSHLPQARVVRIGPLSSSGVADMLAERTDPRTAQWLSAAHYAVSGGNPLLVQALCEDYAASPRTAPGDLVTGDAFAQAVLNCLYRCEPELQTVAGAAAVLDEDATPGLIAGLAGLYTGLVTQALDGLNAIGVLDAYRFRHPDARTTVLGRLTPEDRRSLHARAARALYEEGYTATVVARHLIEAGWADAPWAVPVLREAADYALLEDDLTLAAAALRLALRAGTDDGERAAVSAALARTEWRYSPAVAARRQPQLVAAVRTGRMTGWDAITAVGLLLWEGRVEEAVDALGALDALDRDAARRDPETVVAVRTARQWLSVLYPALSGHADETAERPTTGDPQLRAASGLAAVLRRSPTAELGTDAEHMLQRSRLGGTPVGSIITALTTLVCTGELERAAHWCDAFRRDAADRRVPAWHAIFVAAHAAIALECGDLATAEADSRAALTLIPPNDWGVAVGQPLGTLVLSSAARGKYDAAAAYLARPVPTALFQSIFAVPYLRARGWYHLMTDRYAAALADFQACGDRMTGWGIDLPAFAPWRSDAAQAHLALGEVSRAARLIDEQLALLAPQDFRTRGISLRVRALTREGDERVTLLQAAVHEQQMSGDRHELATAMAALGQALRAVNEYERAEEAARRAYELAPEAVGSPPHPAPALPNIVVDIGGFGDGIAGFSELDYLSNAERRVAALAARGFKNREIADRFYITVSTVEQHLTQVYRKLNVNSRNDLPGDLQHVTPDHPGPP